MPGRTESQCLYKWNLTKRTSSFSKQTWTVAEDELLKELVGRYKNRQWQKIANELHSQSGEKFTRQGK